MIVTGGAGGIGAAACRALAAEGAKVVVADLDADAARAGRRLDRRRRRRRRRRSASTSPTARRCGPWSRAAVEAFGALNVIFNNAGMNRPRDFMEVDEENFEQIVRVNAWGVIVCTQEAARQMIAQGSGGKIVNTGSIAGRQGFWDFVPYCVAKFGDARRHAGDGARPDRARDHRQRVRAGRGRHADVGGAERGPPRDPRRAGGGGSDARVRNRHVVGRPASPEGARAVPRVPGVAESDYLTGQMYMVDGGQVLV